VNEDHAEAAAGVLASVAIATAQASSRRARDPEAEARRKRIRYAENLRAAMLHSARQRAKQAGVPFTLTVDDIIIPKLCPALGITLSRGEGRATDASPSLDRIVPSLGYVPGNVIVLSKRANTIKSNGTGAEILAVARLVLELEADSDFVGVRNIARIRNIERRRNLWYAVLRVPADVREALGKSKLLKSLGTPDRRRAAVLAAPILADWRAMIRRERERLQVQA
jgi:hypothetical protein